MICEEALGLISAYQDGELTTDRGQQVELHLRDCQSCMAAYRANVVVSERIRSDAPTFAPSGALIDRLPRPHRPAVPTVAWAMPLVLAATLTLLWLLPRRSDDTFAQELVADHVRSLMAAHLFDVPSSDRHTVKPWFLGKLDFAPRVPDLKSSGYPLLGGRLDYLDGHPAAALVYAKQKHVINVLVLPLNGRAIEPANLDGYNVEGWQEGDLAYWAVSDIPDQDLKEFEASFKKTP